ncbi:hypothetical protein BVC80_9065g61 [Macleaya cordata]|uniref:DUF7870 domain-containing protein n=1 Tax=Macleaya cordata TaxID=56857 RepID=A0A200PNJ7_MACCD|nr:hypothetical protein BVC80_9065g61 [Macleaya cordata]
MMKFNPGFDSMNQIGFKHLPIGMISDNHLIIRIPNSRVLRVIARSILLALAILTFPWIGSFIGSSSNFVSESETQTGSSDSALLPMLFRDLTNEGLLKSGDKALFFSSGENINPQILIVNEMDLISSTDVDRQNSIPDNTFDFVFVSGFSTAQFTDRTLKTGGIVALRLSDNPSNTFQKPSNYRIVYLRRFESTFVALKKTGPADLSMNSQPKRRLFSFESEAKKAALNGLEGVLLEPPRSASAELKKHLKRTKYLPDILGDSLDGYPRRVFIDVGSTDKNGGSTAGWFERNYPTRNRNFEKYKIEMVSEENSNKEGVPQVGISDWLRKNVKEEEYVVMKAEAEVVEEMVNNKAINLVDELFLECKHQGQSGRKNKSRRAYWECLALYGRLTDEGVAVHQWWGS